MLSKNYLANLANIHSVIFRKLILDGHSFQLPIIKIKGKKEGAKVLVTAGVDGDEYAGIEAACSLITELNNSLVAGEVTILPIVNTFGYEAEVSWNPLDGKYPKHLFPGNNKGSISFQLVNLLVREFLQNSSVWIDLHGGSSKELLTTFLWAFETGVVPVDIKTKQFLRFSYDSLIVFEKKKDLKTQHLAKQGISYLLSEAGGNGKASTEAVLHHKKLVCTVLSELGLILCAPTHIKNLSWNTVVNYFVAPCDGNLLWNKNVAMIYQNNKRKLTIKKPTQGVTLWNKLSGYCQKGDIILAWAR